MEEQNFRNIGPAFCVTKSLVSRLWHPSCTWHRMRASGLIRGEPWEEHPDRWIFLELIAELDIVRKAIAWLGVR